jgi:flap endonuclease-1
MGVKGLSKFIKENIPNAIKKRKLSDLSDSVVAIDTNYYIYKYTISTDDFIKKFASQYLHLTSFGIKPLYVFDGKPPSEKQRVIDKRKKVNLKKNIEVTNSSIKTLKKFFKEHDIPYLECVSEADFICSQLSRHDVIRGCISDDMDFLTLGCKYLYREYYQYSDEIVEYSLEAVLKVFTAEQLIDISIFLGCDYCDRVHDYVNRCHNISVYNLFKTHGTLEGVWAYLYNNDMFIHVDEEKAQNLRLQWTKARNILQNNNNFCYDDMIDKIEELYDQLHENNYKMINIKQYVDDRFILSKTSKLTVEKTFVNKFRNNMFAMLV